MKPTKHTYEVFAIGFQRFEVLEKRETSYIYVLCATFNNTLMTEKIMDRHTAEHYLWGDNCDSWVLADTVGLSVKQESMPIGTKEKLHFHANAQQFFFILKGSATLYLEDNKVILTEQRGILIQPKTKHYIANENSEQLDFLVISQPTTNNDRTNIDQ